MTLDVYRGRKTTMQQQQQQQCQYEPQHQNTMQQQQKLIYPFFPLSPSLRETAHDRLKYCLKGPLNPKPTNNQPTYMYI